MANKTGSSEPDVHGPANSTSRRKYAYKPPSPLLTALEIRASWELGAWLMSMPLLKSAPKGDGHPVLVFPGLAASDFSTIPLRQFLKGIGYTPYPWNFGRNLGPRPGVLRGCAEHVKELREKHGQNVSLIGWSLGGLYAREVAKIAPEVTRCVITLGTPFTGHPKANHAWRFFEFASGLKVGDPKLHEPLRHSPPVPTTSIYSRSDGVVSWKCSLETESPITENIEVIASHLGMGVNPATLFAIADRLSQPEGQWKKFERYGIRKLFYPEPRYYRH